MLAQPPLVPERRAHSLLVARAHLSLPYEPLPLAVARQAGAQLAQRAVPRLERRDAAVVATRQVFAGQRETAAPAAALERAALRVPGARNGARRHVSPQVPQPRRAESSRATVQTDQCKRGKKRATKSLIVTHSSPQQLTGETQMTDTDVGR
ncbi:hypothetical protein GN956_G22877 [Arapaima gigas]